MKTAIIVGAGPAGLTAALEFLKNTDIHPVILEESDTVGGISRTVNVKGNRVDIGGHRFFSKNEEVIRMWKELLPLQGSPAMDDILLGKRRSISPGGPDPENQDKVMLVRDRVSRIFFLRHFLDYPLSIKKTLTGMGLRSTVIVCLGYIRAAIFKKPETSLKNYYINRFGRPLYNMFFKDYTEKVCGVHPDRIGADWGRQRVKAFPSAFRIKDFVTKPFRKNVEKQFLYPKYGPGQMWETAAEKITDTENGGEIMMNHKVVGIITDGYRVTAVEVSTPDGLKRIECDYFLSSMPVKDLVAGLKGRPVPDDISRIADGLPYREFITVCLLVKDLQIRNSTKIKTYGGRIPDTWIYIQEKDIKLGRMQIFNNWSPYLVADYKNTMHIGLDYFCNEGDELWNMKEDEFIDMAVGELEKIGMLKREDVISSVQIKVRKAYPAYSGTYEELQKVREYLDSFENLYCIGRNGQHIYCSTDYAVLTAIEAVKNIVSGD